MATWEVSGQLLRQYNGTNYTLYYKSYPSGSGYDSSGAMTIT